LRAAWPWILLRFKSPGGNRGEQAETHYGRNETPLVHLVPPWADLDTRPRDNIPVDFWKA